MKKLLIATLLIASIKSFAAIDLKFGKGQWICSAEGMNDHPALARSTSKRAASKLAIFKCAEIEGSDFFCKVTKCEKDKRNGDINIDFSISRDGSNVSVDLTNGKAGYLCSTDAFGKFYKAQGPTRIEAETLTRLVCMEEHNGMFCDDVDCASLGNDDGISIDNDGINIGGLLRGVFGRKK